MRQYRCTFYGHEAGFSYAGSRIVDVYFMAETDNAAAELVKSLTPRSPLEDGVVWRPIVIVRSDNGQWRLAYRWNYEL